MSNRPGVEAEFSDGVAGSAGVPDVECEVAASGQELQEGRRVSVDLVGEAVGVLEDAVDREVVVRAS